MPTSSKFKQISARVTPDTHTELEHFAENHGMTLSSLMFSALAEYMTNKGCQSHANDFKIGKHGGNRKQKTIK